MTDEEVKNYRLIFSNGWYYSQQGLILTEDCDKRRYLSKVFIMNEFDDKFQTLKNKVLITTKSNG